MTHLLSPWIVTLLRTIKILQRAKWENISRSVFHIINASYSHYHKSQLTLLQFGCHNLSQAQGGWMY